METTLPDSIGLRIPETWSEYPLDAEEFRSMLHLTAQRASAAEGITRAQVRQLESFLVGVRRLAVDAHVILAAGFVDDETVDAAEQMLAGSVVVSVLDRASMDTDVPLTSDVLVASLANRAGHTTGEFEIDEIEPPTKVEVANLPAVKAVRLMRPRAGSQDSTKVFVMSFFVPVGDGDGVVTLQFGTPNIEFAPDFARLFESIAGTLRVLEPSDPTFDAP